MSHEARAIIRWIPAEKGGRRAPPSSALGYTAPVEIGPGWSLRIVSSTELNGPEVIEARVQFVADEAPHHMLTEGFRFELREGKRIVARGVVLPPAVTVPVHLTDFELALLA